MVAVALYLAVPESPILSIKIPIPKLVLSIIEPLFTRTPSLGLFQGNPGILLALRAF